MELSEEEKKAIEYIKEFRNEVFEGVGNKSTMAKNIDILLNLIKSQQKEIEELKKWHDVFLEMYIHKDKVGANYISKDKIREKIEDLESLSKNITMQPSIYNYEIDLLKELLEEK